MPTSNCISQEEKTYGKRVTDVDAETDRMARLFLGKEDDAQAKQRLKIVQVIAPPPFSSFR